MTQHDNDAERQLLGRIAGMIDEEKKLCDRLANRSADRSADQARLARLEEQLDQCWDLLRQRRARVEAHQDPDGARVRPPSQVEGYLG